MIPKYGDVSLVAVRDDVGVTGSFSMNSREAKNKLNWDDSARALTQYKGNALGLQFLVGGRTLRTHERGVFGDIYNGSEIGEPSGANSQDFFPDEPRQSQYLELRSKRAGNSDSWSENRHQAVFHGGGSVSASMYYKADGDGVYSYFRLALLANSLGFLSGEQQIILDERPAVGNWRKYTSRRVDIPASLPYLTLILYSITSSQAPANSSRTQQYTSLKLQE